MEEDGEARTLTGTRSKRLHLHGRRRHHEDCAYSLLQNRPGAIARYNVLADVFIWTVTGAIIGELDWSRMKESSASDPRRNVSCIRFSASVALQRMQILALARARPRSHSSHSSLRRSDRFLRSERDDSSVGSRWRHSRSRCC